MVSRVIGSFMGIPPEDDEIWARLMNTTLGAGDPDLNPEGVETVMQRDVPEIFERCGRLIAERRERPTDDLTSVLVHAEIDGEGLAEHEIVMGFFLLVAAGNDSTKATYASGMRALLEHPDQKQLLLDDPSLIPSAVEESLRMFPAFAHFRRTATCDTELNGQTIREGEKVVMWYVSSNRDESRYSDPDRFDVTRNPEHQAFGAGGRHFCLGTALARLELRVLFEETLARFPQIELAGRPEYAESPFINQLKTLPARPGRVAGLSYSATRRCERQSGSIPPSASNTIPSSSAPSSSSESKVAVLNSESKPTGISVNRPASSASRSPSGPIASRNNSAIAPHPTSTPATLKACAETSVRFTISRPRRPRRRSGPRRCSTCAR